MLARSDVGYIVDGWGLELKKKFFNLVLSQFLIFRPWKMFFPFFVNTTESQRWETFATNRSFYVRIRRLCFKNHIISNSAQVIVFSSSL